jgi:uncharacterized protein YbaP (TraB family)
MLAAVAIALSGQPVRAEVEAAAPPRHMLWAVTGARNTLYLQGSVHLMKPDAYPLPAVMEAAFATSAVLVTEVDLATMAAPDVQRLFLSRGQLPPGTSLKGLVSPALYAKSAATLESMGVSIGSMASFKPWLLAITMPVIKLQSMGYDPAHGIDSYFDAKARRAGKPVRALETADFQLNLFDSLPNDVQEALLAHTVDEVATIEDDIESLMQAWSTGDEAVILNLLVTDFADFPRLKQTLLTDRNIAWTAAFEQYLQDERDVVAVVGVAHLIGPEGVVALLRQRGYTVRQL